MKRLLIVSPHFVPSNAADMQRVRAVLPYLANAGWRCEVLAVAPEYVAAPQDPWLAAGLPADAPIHRVAALGLRWRRVPGLGTLTYRALGAMRRIGNRLLRERDFNLVYFSTTQFGIHALGPLWRRRFGVPFVMDYQDPWVSDYYRTHPDVPPPGGRVKYEAAGYLARRAEPRVLAVCSGVTSVSEDYLRQLREHYPATMRDMPTLVAPFPGDDADLCRVAADASIRQTCFTPGDGRMHWVYVGRGGHDMHRALRPFFLALAAQLEVQPTLAERLRIHFIGTSYAAAGGGKKTIQPLAAECGVGKNVTESPDRIPYSTTLRCLLDADALIVPGSDDPAYTASKIYPYLLARKPLLAIFHEASSVTTLLQTVGGGIVVPFSSNVSPEDTVQAITRSWFDDERFATPTPLDDIAFAPYTAARQAASLADFFSVCVANARKEGAECR
jgi:hypothetical protein